LGMTRLVDVQDLEALLDAGEVNTDKRVPISCVTDGNLAVSSLLLPRADVLLENLSRSLRLCRAVGPFGA
jgi:hypothetical protein